MSESFKLKAKLFLQPSELVKRSDMQKLRECGIYTLPDGSEFVVHAVFRGGYVLYTPRAWELFGMHVYETNDAGQICAKGQRTSWHIADLIDTSRTARSRSRSGNAQSHSPVR